MFGLGTQELLVILVIVLVMFGGSKLPEIARSLGKSMNEFKKGIDEGARDDESVVEERKARQEQKAVRSADGARHGQEHGEPEHRP
jgi:sec-independent protein translocase protein TatA